MQLIDDRILFQHMHGLDTYEYDELKLSLMANVKRVIIYT